MVKNTDSDKVTIELPENLQDSGTRNNKPIKKRAKFKIFMSILILTAILLAGVGGYYKLKYNDQYLKDTLVQALTARSDLKLNIGSLESDWLGCSLKLTDVDVYGASNNDIKVFELSDAAIKIDLFKSISEKSLVLNVVIDKYVANVERIVIKDKVTGKDEYSTNISQILDNLILLPWKKWLGDIDWRTASGSIKLTNGRVNVTDRLNLLDDCVVADINTVLSRNGDDIDFSFSVAGATPNSSDGTINIDLLAELADNFHKIDPAHLSFLNDINLDCNIDNFDIPYFLHYFGYGQIDYKNFHWDIAAPVNADIKLNSNTLANVNVVGQVNVKNIFKMYYKEELLPAAPAVSIKTECKLNLLKAWTKFKPVNFEVNVADSSGELFTVGIDANGDFGSEILLTLTSDTDLTRITNSPLGKYFELGFSGSLEHTAACIWRKNQAWKINYDVTGKNVTANIDGATISMPITASIDGIIKHVSSFDPQSGSLNFDIKTPFLKLKSLKPLELDFTNRSSLISTSVDFSADFAGIYSTFHTLFERFNLGRIDEIIAGKINANTQGIIDWDVQLMPKSNMAANKNIVNFKGGVNPADNNKYTIKADLANTSKSINVSINGNMQKNNSEWVVGLAQSGIVDLADTIKLYSRYKNLFSGKDFPLPLTGKLREAFNASAIISDKNNFSIGLSLRANATNFKTVVNKHPINEDKINIKSSFSFKKKTKSSLVSFKNFEFVTPNSSLKFSTDPYDLAVLNAGSWRKALKAFPAVTAEVTVGAKDMSIIGGTIGNEIANMFLQNSIVKGKFTSNGATKATLTSFKYNAPLINVESKKTFTIDPLLMTEKIISKNFFEIHKSLSDVDVLVDVDMDKWRRIVPEVALGVVDKFSFDAMYRQKGDKLLVRQFATTEQSRSNLLISTLNFKGAIVDFFKILPKINITDFVSSIDGNLFIDKLVLSVAQMKFLAGNDPGSNLRALQGESVNFSNCKLQHKLGQATAGLTGEMSAKMAYFSRSSKWPIMSIEGAIDTDKKPILIKITDDSVTAKGSLNFDNSAIEFNALSPYHYNKPISEMLKLDFYGAADNQGRASVQKAELIGGPLAVSLTNLQHQPIGNRYKLTLSKGVIGRPINTTIENLLLDSSSDILKGDIIISNINLDNFQNNLNLSFPINITGSIGTTNIKLNDSYWRYFAPVGVKTNTKKIGKNRLTLGASNIKISSATPNADAEIAFSIAGGNGDTASNSIVLKDVEIANPKNYSKRKAISAETVSITPELQTLFSDQIIIDRMDINKLSAFYEVAFKKSNIAALSDNLKLIFSGDAKNTEAHSRNTLIRDIYVTNSVVNLSTTLLKGKASIPIPLDMHLENVGGEDAGTTFTSVFGKLFAGIGKAGSGVIGGVGSAVKGVGSIGKSIITAPLKLIKDVNKDMVSEE